jgi:hypothetical protein
VVDTWFQDAARGDAVLLDGENPTLTVLSGTPNEAASAPSAMPT